jgi:hypothetical protein
MVELVDALKSVSSRAGADETSMPLEALLLARNGCGAKQNAPPSLLRCRVYTLKIEHFYQDRLETTL